MVLGAPFNCWDFFREKGQIQEAGRGQVLWVPSDQVPGTGSAGAGGTGQPALWASHRA